MEKSWIIKNLFSKKTQDYTYTIAFFFIFSFFVYFIIRPNLIKVFEITTKIEQLKNINKNYGEEIDKIVNIQSELELNRDDFGLLKEAIAAKPDVNKVLYDVLVSSDEGNLRFDRAVVSDINLKDKGSADKLKFFIINMNLAGTFEDTMAFIERIYNQRRLKLIPEFELAREEKESSDSGALKIRLEVEGYYL